MQSTAALVCTLVVVVAHLFFMTLEMFLWTTPYGRHVFSNSLEEAERTKVMAANQGIYNGALAVVLAWAALSGDVAAVIALLGFVVVVGLYGGFTVKRSVFVAQALPAALALALTLMA